jgi:mono/diheme cytochrome c family protein
MRSQRNAFGICILLLAACQSAPPEPTFTPEPTTPPTETPFVAAGIDIFVELPPGDAERGLSVVKQRGCLACHGSGSVLGPPWQPNDDSPGIGARAQTRFQEGNYTGEATNAEQYLVESIVTPSVYIVENYADGVMLPNMAQLLSQQDLADVVAYLLTLE